MKVGIIPARMGSSRFPGKPLAPINGVPMVELVMSNVSKAKDLDAVFVATCDSEIYEHVVAKGGKAIMTGSHHERASDRCAEATQKIEAETGVRIDIVVMIQGDEPMISGAMIDMALIPFYVDESVDVVNLMAPILGQSEFEDKNTIKVVCDNKDNALLFSRQPIPYGANCEVRFKQVCVIPFRRDFLLDYTAMPPTPLEIEESIDMLRILEHGGRVKMVKTSIQTQAVDTPDDLSKVVELLKLSEGEA
jgi:3-deoxy-manno-octulosonate cytidylyltransferase (CMP-KDO synthetase)